MDESEAGMIGTQAKKVNVKEKANANADVGIVVDVDVAVIVVIACRSSFVVRRHCRHHSCRRSSSFLS